MGLLRVRVQKGVNLAIRDVTARTSDPYVVIKMGKQVTWFSSPYVFMSCFCFWFLLELWTLSFRVLVLDFKVCGFGFLDCFGGS